MSPLPPEATILGVAQGSTRDAWLLMRIVYWTRYAKVEFNGKVWVVHSHEEWEDETGLGPRAIQRALRSLSDKGVIETERHLFGTKIRCYIRLSSMARKLLGLPKVVKSH